jgi:hypothetical protein
MNDPGEHDSPWIFWRSPVTRTVCACIVGLSILRADSAAGVPRTWDGGGADNLASSPTNWVGDVAPVIGDEIRLDGTSTKDITWDAAAPSTVAAWSQLVGYTGTVTFETHFPGEGSPTNITITGNCTVNDGTWTHPANTGGTTEVDRLAVSVGGAFTLGAGGTIDLNEKGYTTSQGPGTGGCLSGSAYGGQPGTGNGANNASTYGSIKAPTNLGSGSCSGRGGGAVRLSVVGATTIDGNITAHGKDNPGSWAYTGSGGSVFLTTDSLAGSGFVSARGANSTHVGTGGGGRVAVILTGSDSFGSVTMSAVGGDAPGDGDAAPGTIYTETQSQGSGAGTLLVTNSVVHRSDRFTDIGSLVTDPSVGNVLLGVNARFRVNTNQTFTVSGVWSNGGAYTPGPGSRVVISGTGGSADVYGSSTFAELAIEAPGKTINFELGTTNGVLEQLILTGNSGSELVLQSMSGGSQWGLNVDPAAIQTIQDVDVRDSDAAAGAAAVALDSTDTGNNVNWVFATAGQIDIWTGASNTEWGVAANWNLGRGPIAADAKTVISAASSNFPTLPSDQTLNHVEIQAGATLYLGGYNLTVPSVLDVDGILVASSNETISANGDVDFSFGIFSNAQSHFVITGSNTPTVTSHAEGFYHLSITNQDGAVTFTDTISAKFFESHDVSIDFQDGINAWRAWSAVGVAVVTQCFGAASSSTITNLYILGEPGVFLEMKSANPGNQWDLNVVRCAHVRYAKVTDSDASGGRWVYPVGSVNGGNNPNWNFGGPWSTWTGTTSQDFLNPTNWTPIAVPGAATRVLLDGDAANSLVVTSTVTFRQLVVGPTRASTMTAHAPVTVLEDINVMDQGVLALDRPSGVSNNLVVVDGGFLTHSVNGDLISNRLDVTVGSALFVDEGGQINADIKGYTSSRGPGRPQVSNAAATHGGEGGSNNPGNLGLTYGSIRAPLHAGSGAAGGAGAPGAGGGVVRLNVLGATTVNGDITVNGGDGKSWTYQGSGGSVYLTTGTLTGSGRIQAHGGNIPASGGAGGGGRVSLVVAGGGYGDVETSARGGTSNAGGARGAPGTVYRSNANKGQVLVESELTSTVDCLIPPETNAVANELKNTVLIVTNVGGKVRLTGNYTVSDLFVYPNTFLTLSNFNLNVRAAEHHLDGTERGPGSTNVVDHYTQIHWFGKGLVMQVR